jgi:hypothetical protein
MRRLGSELRQRKHLKVIQELDAFPKVPESYQKTTASGGTGYILTHVHFCFVQLIINIKQDCCTLKAGSKCIH